MQLELTLNGQQYLARSLSYEFYHPLSTVIALSAHPRNAPIFEVSPSPLTILQVTATNLRYVTCTHGEHNTQLHTGTPGLSHAGLSRVEGSKSADLLLSNRTLHHLWLTDAWTSRFVNSTHAQCTAPALPLSLWESSSVALMDLSIEISLNGQVGTI